MVNVAVIGAGFMGRTHVTAYKAMPNAKVTAVCDLNEKQAKTSLSLQDVIGITTVKAC